MIPRLRRRGAIHSGSPGRAPRVSGAVGRFMLGSLAAIGVIVIGGFFALRRVAIDEAVRGTRPQAQAEARLVESAGLRDGILRGDLGARRELDELVRRK